MFWSWMNEPRTAQKSRSQNINDAAHLNITTFFQQQLGTEFQKIDICQDTSGVWQDEVNF